MSAPPDAATPRLRTLASPVLALEAAVHRAARAAPERAGQREAGGSALERVSRLVDQPGSWFEIGALRGHDHGDGARPGAGMITGIGTVGGQPVVVAATHADPAARAWRADTVSKLLRAQEIALRQQLSIVYLLEGGPDESPMPDSHFPGGYGPGRVLAHAAAMRRSQRVWQLAALPGQASFASLLAELADETVPLTGEGLAGIRERLLARAPRPRLEAATRATRPAAVSAAELEHVLPADHRRSYDMLAVLRGLLDAGDLDEFQPRHGAEMLCGHGWIEGIPIAVITNRRGVIPAGKGQPRLGGIIYTASASKVAFFIETASRQRLPILFVHDVSGFMLGVEAEHSGIIRAGAGLVEAMATARSPRLALTINHASGAGYYAMASQGFEPDFTLAWPTGRIGAMEAEAAINAAHGTALAKSGGAEADAPAAVRASIAAMRASFERELEAVHAAARGHVDAIILPETTRSTLAFLLRVAARPAGP